MKRNEILQHFPNGCTVECLRSKTKSIFNGKSLAIRDVYFQGYGLDSAWCFHDSDKGLYIVVERKGKLATIIEPENDIVFAQLGKEVKTILDKESNDQTAGSIIRKLYYET